MSEDPHVLIPVSLARSLIGAIDDLNEIIENEVDIPEGGCNCASISMPPCSFCENNGHYAVQIGNAEGQALTLSKHLDAQDLDRIAAAIAEDEDAMEGFGAF